MFAIATSCGSFTDEMAEILRKYSCKNKYSTHFRICDHICLQTLLALVLVYAAAREREVHSVCSLLETAVKVHPRSFYNGHGGFVQQVLGRLLPLCTQPGLRYPAETIPNFHLASSNTTSSILHFYTYECQALLRAKPVLASQEILQFSGISCACTNSDAFRRLTLYTRDA